MCGIVGYVGKDEAGPVLLHGLQRLEYRGYDSSGLAVRMNNDEPIIVKAEGKLINLIEKTRDGLCFHSNSGIGHTRWATHGAPTEVNAHPHASDDCAVIGVHNGIIENFQELKDKLLRNKYKFKSETDTEVIVKLIDYYYKKYKIGPIDAINKTMVRARGSYALALMFKDYPNQVWFAKKGSPLIVAKSDEGGYLASDVPAILKYSNQVYYVDDFECGVIKEDGIRFYDLNGDDITNKKELVTIDWKADSVDLGDYKYHMEKEIAEQPQALKDTINAYLNAEGRINFPEIGLTKEYLNSLGEIYIFACGSAYHAGVVAEYLIEDLANVNVRCELASEFKYRNYKMNPKSLAIVISQSGETKDTYEAMMKAKANGIKTLAICNVKGSTITRDADFNLYTYAGPEIAVATTKAYSCQLAVLYLFTLFLARTKYALDRNKYYELLDEVKELPAKVEKTIELKEQVQRLSARFTEKTNVFFIGRGIDYAVCMEAALKLKEITYINSNAYAAGELKHGTISLIEKGVATVAIATQPRLIEKTVSNMVEVKSRDGSVVALTTKGNNVENSSKYQIYIPEVNPLFAASLSIIPLQQLAFYTSLNKGINPDKPRNLAKSVTVE
ncbi:MAG: glutamine--fructose-6-phosphate transaminase (isomerizing) [Acholeplasmatales bacterium]|nr:glutamine--fructose-6-phosphate transaminase (isomerizing) [Acholeplasmatales bacterium]